MSDSPKPTQEKPKKRKGGNYIINTIITSILLRVLTLVFLVIKPSNTAQGVSEDYSDENYLPKITIITEVIDISSLKHQEVYEKEIPGRSLVTIKKDVDHNLSWNCNGTLKGVATCAVKENTFTISQNGIKGTFPNCEFTELTNLNQTSCKLKIKNN